MSAQHQIGLGRPRAPAAVDHIAFAAAGLVVKKVTPGRDFEGLKVDLETLLLEHAGDQLGIFLGLGIEANRCVVGKLGQALPLGEAGLPEQLLRPVRIELGIVGHVGVTELTGEICAFE